VLASLDAQSTYQLFGKPYHSAWLLYTEMVILGTIRILSTVCFLCEEWIREEAPKWWVSALKLPDEDSIPLKQWRCGKLFLTTLFFLILCGKAH